MHIALSPDSFDKSNVYQEILSRIDERITERTKNEISVDLNRTKTSERVRTAEG
jgi:chromosome condensin MukBEF MukE localization factor